MSPLFERMCRSCAQLHATASQIDRRGTHGKATQVPSYEQSNQEFSMPTTQCNKQPSMIPTQLESYKENSFFSTETSSHADQNQMLTETNPTGRPLMCAMTIAAYFKDIIVVQSISFTNNLRR